MNRQVKEWLIVVVLVLILGRFVTQTYAKMITNSNSAEGDQQAFLQLGLDLREKGVLTDGTRNPLYPAFLAVVAKRDWVYFSQAKLLSLTFGVLTIVSVYVLGRRFFNTFTGLASAILLSVNAEFIGHSATALTESLLVLTFILAWFAMIKALDDQENWPYWGLAGILAGLTYLAKGSGQLMAIAFLISAVLFYRFKLFQTRGLWIFLAGYSLVASPLWIYNTSRFGSPTFNYAISHQMWLERWTDWHPDAVDSLPTFRSYLQHHSVSDIVSREWVGMRALRNVFAKTLWPTRSVAVDRFLMSPLSSLVIGLLAVLPVIFWRSSRQYIRQNRAAVYLTVLTIITFYLLFAWYVPIVALGQRFLLPLIPPIFILLMHIVSLIWPKVAGLGLWPKRIVVTATMIALIYLLGWAGLTNLPATRIFFSRDLFEQDRRFNADAATPLAWLVATSDEPAVVAYGPAGKSLPTWAYSDRLIFERYPPKVDTISELTQNLVSRNVDYVIVSPDMVARQGGYLRDQFPSAGNQIEVSAIPAGWALTYAYRDMPCNWCIFQLLESSPPGQSVDYWINDTIQLAGYDLERGEIQPGQTVNLTLYWTTDNPIVNDYTVFTQLLGPDFQLHGQLDRQPINNLWPTSRWRPGDCLADRYNIPSDVNAPAGEYQLLVGMYDSQTGQRQTVSQNGTPVPDDAIPLAAITLTLE